MSRPKLLTKTTVRGYGSVEVWHLQQTDTYEITLTYSFPSHKTERPPSEFEYTLYDALQIMTKLTASLVSLKTIVEAA